MPVKRTLGQAAPPSCRWRTSDETLDLIEALERIEALLLRLDERIRRIEASVPLLSDALDTEAVAAGVAPSGL